MILYYIIVFLILVRNLNNIVAHHSLM